MLDFKGMNATGHNNMEYEPSGYGKSIETDLNTGLYNFTIKEFIVAPSRPYGYRNMLQRSYTSNLTTRDTNNIAEDVLRNGKLGNSSQSTSNILRVSATPIADSEISGGWSSQRYTFQLEVRCAPTTSGVIHTPSTTYDLVITGYSEPSNSFVHKDPGGNLYPDTQLVFRINSIQRVGLNAKMNSIVGIDNIGLSTPTSFNSNSDTVCVRPVDIVSGINSAYAADAYIANVLNVDYTPLMAPVDFNRGQVVGKKYVNDVVNGMIDGLGNSLGTRAAFSDAFNSNMEMALVETSTILRNDMSHQDAFLIALRQITYGRQDNAFTINDLMKIDKSFTPNRVKYANIQEESRFNLDGILTSADTATLHGATRLNAKVTELHNTIVSMLTSNFLSHIEIRIWNSLKPNENGFGHSLQPDYEVPGDKVSWTYDPAATSENAIFLLRNSIEGHIKYLLDPMLSETGNIQYDVMIVADVSNDTTIAISLDNSEPILYRFPTFADMSYTPLVGDTRTKESLVASIGSLTNAITDTVSSQPMDSTYNSNTSHFM